MTREYIIEKLKKDYACDYKCIKSLKLKSSEWNCEGCINKDLEEYEKEIYNKALEDVSEIMWADGDMYKMYIDEFEELKG